MSKRWQMYPSRLFKRWGFSFMCIAVLWLPYFTGDHKIILGENDIPNPNDVNLYTITIEGLFVQLIKTRFFQAFSHRCEVPRVSRPILQETQTLVRTTWLCDANFEGKDMQLVRFFLLEEQAEECFNWCDTWYSYLLLRVQRHRQSENKTVNLWPMVVGVRDAYTFKKVTH